MFGYCSKWRLLPIEIVDFGWNSHFWRCFQIPPWICRVFLEVVVTNSGLILSWKSRKLLKMSVFDNFWGGRSRNPFVLASKLTKSVKKCVFWVFGSKSLKSDNFTFFRILRIIDENEGGILLWGGCSELTWYCHSKSPASPLERFWIVLFSLYFLFCKFYNKCGYTTGSFWRFKVRAVGVVLILLLY